MPGPLKVKVDRERCQGHARCDALAPELFALDELGNAQEVGDGSVPAGLEDEGLSRQVELSGTRDRDHRGGEAMTTRPPVNDWGSDFDHLDPRWVNDPYPIWEALRGTCPVAHTRTL